jgi:glycosyltransferase involved in cell wall biosynthesis
MRGYVTEPGEMMRIAINLIGYTPGRGGVETYVTNLLVELQNINSENQYIVLCNEDAVSSLNVHAANFSLKVYSYQEYSTRWIIRGLLKRICGFDTLCRELNNLPVDVMHHPLTVLNPPGLPYPSVLTFHDMQQEFYPEFFSRSELDTRRKSYLSSVHEADAIITVSEHAGACLIDKYGIDAGKIHVVHSGCGEEFCVRDISTLSEILTKYSIDRPFILYPAALWPHKNHLRLLEAVKILVDRGDFDGSLLLTGAPIYSESKLMKAISSFGLLSRVRWLGYIPKEDLSYLYNLARFMVFPSLFEGFGLPVVEAMASGCPVVCSSNSSLPEVGGFAVLYFDPLNLEDIAEKISLLWNNDFVLNELKMQGLIQASKFSWDETAKRTLEVYRNSI